MTETVTDDDNWFSDEAATFGDRMAGAREAGGLSQEDLAKRLGVKLKTIRGWENDVAEPRANRLQMMSGILNVSLMWLLNGEGDGLDHPHETHALSGDIRGILLEIREVKSQIAMSAERLGRLEKALRHTLEEDGVP